MTIEEKIEKVLKEIINPILESHGGQVKFERYENNIAYISMSGGCQGCGMAKLTLKNGVERMLLEEIDEVEEVIDITDHSKGLDPYMPNYDFYFGEDK